MPQTLHQILCRATFFALLALPIAVPAQTPQRGQPVPAPVELAPQPDLFTGHLQAFPRVLPGPAVTPAVAQTINVALAREEATVRAAAQDCRTSMRQEGHKPANDAWQRTVAVTMRGPRLLSFVATDSYFCGGPYPNDGLQTPFVYDLTTGRPVNWLSLLPAGPSAERGTAADGSKAGWILWPRLQQLAHQQAAGECKDAFSNEPVAFAIYPDAASHSLKLFPADFPHVIQACAEPVSLDIPTLKSLKTPAALLTALE